MNLYAGQIVNLLAQAGIPRIAIDLEDAVYSTPDESWLFTKGMQAYRAQALEPRDEAWDCDNIATDFALFMAKCHYRNGLKTGCSVFKLRYLPDVFPWKKPNELWVKHKNNVVVFSDHVVFIEPQMFSRYEPSEMDLGTVEFVTDP